MEQSTGRSLGSHYRLRELLGRGAMGEVYVAEDVDTGERLAAKVLRADHTHDEEVTARFLQERKLLRELTHPNIVRVRELVVDRDAIAIVMDLIEGEDLRKRLRSDGRLTPAEAVRICADVLAALSMAHSLEPPVQHRDVKPDNVLLSHAGDVFLTDFGVARLAEVGTAVKLTNGIGTADYMAPEMSGSTAGSPADVYAVGVTLYELLAGHPPFGKGTFAEVALRHMTCLPPVIDDLPPALWAHVEALLVKNPASRPSAATAEARLRALLPDVEGVAAVAPRPVPTEWARVAGGVADSLGTAFDEPGTLIKGVPQASAAVLPVAGLDAAVGVRRDGLTLDDGVTSLASREAVERDREAARPAVTPAVRTAEKRRTWLWVLVAAVAAVAVVVGVVVLSKSPSHGGAAGIAASDAITVPAKPSENAVATGLLTSRGASYDPKTKLLTVSISLTNSSKVNMPGPFLEALPPVAGDQCQAQVAWEGTNALASAVVTDKCAYDVLKGGLAVGQPQTIQYTIPFSVPASSDTAQAAQSKISTYLSNEDEQTATALLEPGATSDKYPVQRLAGMYVMAPSTTLANSPLDLTVNPIWQQGDAWLSPGGDLGKAEFDNNNVLFSGAPGSALANFGHITWRTPAGADCTISQVTDTKPAVGGQAQNCSVIATVDGVDSEPSNVFEVVPQP